MLACSAEAGLTTTALARHVPLLRRNIGAGDQVSLLSRCVGSDGLGSGDHVLMLTGQRLVVTRQSRLLGRVRLCLDAPVAAIENLRWSADPAGPGVELNFTVLEGPHATEPRRWHFWLPATHAKRVWRVDALLARAFRRPKATAGPAGKPRSQRVNPLLSPSGVFPVVPAPAFEEVFPSSPLRMDETVRLVRPLVAAVDVPHGHVPAPRSACASSEPRRPATLPPVPSPLPLGPAPKLAAA
ncbi:hypothetical protein [Glycomyces terrestris]|uniref:Uncharacterized protein n=1 Tax=Glycomyces terrestris TaxID=2493553 RepID=A0A426US23_9ACTN|nr:hypothetical protein [Glycomyces terrestris]RRR96019.1 hypothetical protein EIW28_22395 [Glycomyces terrestris]